MSWPARLTAPLCALLIALAMVPSAMAGFDAPIAGKDGSTYNLEDLSCYYLRNLGKDGLLDFLQNMVVYQEGAKQGLKPTQQERDSFISDTMGSDVYAQFKSLFSPRAVDQMVDYTLINSKYEKWLRDKIKKEKNFTVSEKDAKDYFLKHIAEFHLPEGAYLSLISVDNETQAKAVLDRLKKGEDFRKVAGEVNMDPKMRAANGVLGVVRKGEGLPKPLEDAAFKLKEGTFSDIVHGQNYHILFCHKRYAEVTPTFDDIKEQLMHDMIEAMIDPVYEDDLRTLMSKELPRFNIQADLFKPQDEAEIPPAKPPAIKSAVGGAH